MQLLYCNAGCKQGICEELRAPMLLGCTVLTWVFDAVLSEEIVADRVAQQLPPLRFSMIPC